MSTVVCPHCGTQATAGQKFCNTCGTALPAVGASVRPAPRPAAPSQSRARGLSIWWLVVPTAIFAFLSRNPVEVGIAVAIAAALWTVKFRQIPATASPAVRNLQPLVAFAPALQIAVVFVLLGGSLVVMAVLVAGIAAAIYYRERLIDALEPWWRFQSSIPPAARKPLAFAAPFVVGYYFGLTAGGQEWTYTLISLSLGIAIAFLILFTPPDSMRRGKRA